jgi:hypothetical protein
MVGALTLAQLMSAGGKGSPAFIIAYYLTSWMGKGYLAIAGVWGGGRGAEHTFIGLGPLAR